MTGSSELNGRSILVVENDYYIAFDTAAALRDAGAEVLGPYGSEDAVRRALVTRAPTGAVLDLNLCGYGPRFEVARMLRARGIPFVFVTGYDPEVIPGELADVELLQKPVASKCVIAAVGRL
jgi:CheY-like chemotaxis protein